MADNDMTMKDFMDSIKNSNFRLKSGDIVKGKVISVSSDEIFVNIGYVADGIIKKEDFTDDPEADLTKLVKNDDELTVYVIDINDGEGNVSLSKRRADSIKVWDLFDDSIQNGTTFNVRVNEVVKGGVTAEFMGVRAFIPASQLSFYRTDDLNKFLGKTIEVKAIEADKDSKKVILSHKDIDKAQMHDKKSELFKTIQVGDIRDGIVRNLTTYGAFVEIEEGIDGLVHITEITDKNISRPSDVLKIGDKVKIKVIGKNVKDKKLSLSIKEAQNDSNEDFSEFEKDDSLGTSLGDVLKDKLKGFKFE